MTQTTAERMRMSVAADIPNWMIVWTASCKKPGTAQLCARQRGTQKIAVWRRLVFELHADPQS
jgi:hypothetical protein